MNPVLLSIYEIMEIYKISESSARRIMRLVPSQIKADNQGRAIMGFRKSDVASAMKKAGKPVRVIKN